MSKSEAAEAITRHRERLRWSKRRLARETGLSPAYIVQLENGDRPVTARAITRIADGVGLHPYKLLTEAGFIPADATAEAERMAGVAMQDPEKVKHARADDTGGQYAWLVADYLMLLGHDAYGTETDGPWIVGVDWSDLAPERWTAMREGRANSQTIADVKQELAEWTAARAAAPSQIEGWDRLNESERRLLQSMANQLLRARSEGDCTDGDS